jgi:D-proline reductase (dithiol) PrdB
MPIEYIARSEKRAAERGTKAYEYTQNQDTPWTPLSKPLNECRIGLISSGGLYLEDQPVFEDRDDVTFREIPADVDQADLLIHHVGYDHTDADRDPNIVQPIDPLVRLAHDGTIKDLASPVFSFMGRIPSRLQLVNETLPVLVSRLDEMEVDACVLVGP